MRLYPTSFKQTKSVFMQCVLLGEGGGKKKETHLSNKKKKIHTQTVIVFNIFTIESSKNLTRPNFVFMVIYTHDSSILVHELNLISVFGFKFTLSTYNINSTRCSGLQVDTKGMRLFEFYLYLYVTIIIVIIKKFLIIINYILKLYFY